MIRNKKYAGLIWAMIIWCLYYGAVFVTTKLIEGTALYISYIIIKIILCSAAFFTVKKIYGRKVSDILSTGNSGKALFYGIGFLLFLIYYITIILSGFASFKNISAGPLVLSLISYAAAVIFEEILFRVLILEGYHSSEDQGWKTCLLFTAVNFIVYGAVHISGGNLLYSFIVNGTIGLSMSVIYIRTRNIIVPALLQFIYCILSVVQNICEWNGTDLLLRLLSVYYFFISVIGVLSVFMLLKDDPDIHKMLDMKKEGAK